MYYAKLDSCAVGLSTKDHTPIKKPWTIATDEPCLVAEFTDCFCPGKDEHPQHKWCCGKDAKESELYTKEMVKKVHQAWVKATQSPERNSCGNTWNTTTRS